MIDSRDGGVYIANALSLLPTNYHQHRHISISAVVQKSIRMYGDHQASATFGQKYLHKCLARLDVEQNFSLNNILVASK